MSNSFGEYLRITTWGESHGPGIGVVIDGLPAGVPVSIETIAADLARRRPGGDLASSRKEPDTPKILSGVLDGKTLGSPLAIWIESIDARSEDYDEMADLYRPGHADFTTEARYGHRDRRGGGRASARETAARVAAGAVCRVMLAREYGIEIVGWVDELSGNRAEVDPATVDSEAVELSPVRCPALATSGSFVDQIERAREAGDSLGGWVGVVARGVPAGWGDPVFAKMKSLLGAAMLSIPAAMSLELGDGIAATGRTGSENNDSFTSDESGTIHQRTNRSGGMQGGITSGAPLWLRVGFKPTSTIGTTQETVNRSGDGIQFEGKGRHDPCVLPRAVAIVEAMMALVLVDRMLARRATPPASG
ncbi:MAG TPA: chorismate synthase [Planctomycetes bacterium]|nr:chorismate synthase [Planctomycetota bacterium]